MRWSFVKKLHLVVKVLLLIDLINWIMMTNKAYTFYILRRLLLVTSTIGEANNSLRSTVVGATA